MKLNIFAQYSYFKKYIHMYIRYTFSYRTYIYYKNSMSYNILFERLYIKHVSEHQNIEFITV